MDKGIEMTENENSVLFVELTAGIVSAYVSNNPVPTDNLAELIVTVHASISKVSLPTIVESEKPTPAVNPKRSVFPDYIICLEDGKRFKSLKRHLTLHGLSPEEYRAKWGLPSDYPMAAPGYSAMRSDQAKRIGLGRKPVAKKTTTKRGGRKAR